MQVIADEMTSLKMADGILWDMEHCRSETPMYVYKDP